MSILYDTSSSEDGDESGKKDEYTNKKIKQKKDNIKETEKQINRVKDALLYINVLSDNDHDNCNISPPSLKNHTDNEGTKSNAVSLCKIFADIKPFSGQGNYSITDFLESMNNLALSAKNDLSSDEYKYCIIRSQGAQSAADILIAPDYSL